MKNTGGAYVALNTTIGEFFRGVQRFLCQEQGWPRLFEFGILNLELRPCRAVCASPEESGGNYLPLQQNSPVGRVTPSVSSPSASMVCW
jgi:hypothetical protein